MKGQLSAEMLILIVVVLAVVAIVATQLLKTAEKSGEAIDAQSQAILDKSEAAIKAKKGDFCVKDEDCLSNKCFENSCN